MPEKEPRLDLSRLDLPCDRLTFKHLRTHLLEDEAAGYGVLGGTLLVPGLEEAAWIIKHEVGLAVRAFEEALGKKRKDRWPEERQETITDLIEVYARFGVVLGPYQMEQLVRQLEATAAAQAGEHLGKTP